MFIRIRNNVVIELEKRFRLLNVEEMVPETERRNRHCEKAIFASYGRPNHIQVRLMIESERGIEVGVS